MPADLDALRERLERAETGDYRTFNIDDADSMASKMVKGATLADSNLIMRAIHDQDLNAAVALVQRVRPGWRWIVESWSDAQFKAHLIKDEHRIEFVGRAPTAALALLLALVRSLIEEQP